MWWSVPLVPEIGEDATPTHRGEAAMNEAQSRLSGPPAHSPEFMTGSPARFMLDRQRPLIANCAMNGAQP